VQQRRVIESRSGVHASGALKPKHRKGFSHCQPRVRG
jgi:hypothetical protein